MNRSTKRDANGNPLRQPQADPSPQGAEPEEAPHAGSARGSSRLISADAYFRQEGNRDSLTVYCTVCGPNLPGAAPGALLDARRWRCSSCGSPFLVN